MTDSPREEPRPENVVKAEALDEAAAWLDGEAANFTVSKIADEGLFNAAIAATANVLEALASSLRRRAKEMRSPE